MSDRFVVPADYRMHIRPELCAALERYFNDRIATGSFLRAVLENNWLEAIKRQNPPSLGEQMWLADLLLDCPPSTAWGSKAAVAAWLAEPLAESEEPDPEERG